MSEENTVGWNLDLDVSPARARLHDLTAEVTKATKALQAMASLARRLGLPPEADAQIMKLQKIINTAYTLQAAFIAVQMASGPWGWLMAGISIAGAAVTYSDTLQEVYGR